MEEIICFKCRRKIGFMKGNNFKMSHYGDQNFILTCECGEEYLLQINIKRLIPGGFPDDWKG